MGRGRDDLLDAGVDEADGVRRLALAERDRREGHAWLGGGGEG